MLINPLNGVSVKAAIVLWLPLWVTGEQWE